MKQYAKRVIESNECDSFDEITGQVRMLSDRTCDLSARIAALEAKTLRVGDPVIVIEDGQQYPGIVAVVHDDGLFDVDFPDGDDCCCGPEELIL